MIEYYIGKKEIKFVQQYGSLWKSHSNIVYIQPIRKNPSYDQYLKSLNFIDSVQQAGNNIYQVKVNKQILKKFLKKDKIMKQNKQIGFWKALFNIITMGTPKSIANKIANDPQIKARAKKVKQYSQELQQLWKQKQQQFKDSGWI